MTGKAGRATADLSTERTCQTLVSLMVDHFTTATETAPMPDSMECDVDDCLFIFYGVPEPVDVGNVGELADAFQHAWERLGIVHVRTGADELQSNVAAICLESGIEDIPAAKAAGAFHERATLLP